MSLKFSAYPHEPSHRPAPSLSAHRAEAFPRSFSSIGTNPEGLPPFSPKACEWCHKGQNIRQAGPSSSYNISETHTGQALFVDNPDLIEVPTPDPSSPSALRWPQTPHHGFPGWRTHFRAFAPATATSENCPLESHRSSLGSSPSHL